MRTWSRCGGRGGIPFFLKALLLDGKTACGACKQAAYLCFFWALSVDDPRLERYLKGETLTIEPEEAAHSKGWHLLCVEGYPLGFGKLVNGTLKNKYPAGWRV